MSGASATAPIAIIADDEDLGRLLLAEAASAGGLTPLAFDNGTAALEAALSQDVAIVLLDVDMPGLDGYSVCRRLRAESRGARELYGRLEAAHPALIEELSALRLRASA